MELKDFIENSVSDIVDAIKDLKVKYNTEYVRFGGTRKFEPNPIASDHTNFSENRKPTSIEFDIAVASSETGKSETGGKIGIKVLGAQIGGELGYKNENSSRIKFSIPFYPEYIKKD